MKVEKTKNEKLNISINGSLQIILVLFIMLVGIILANLIVGLTVNKTEELFQKADMHFNIKVKDHSKKMLHAIENTNTISEGESDQLVGKFTYKKEDKAALPPEHTSQIFFSQCSTFVEPGQADIHDR